MSRWNHNFLFESNPLTAFWYLQIKEDECYFSSLAVVVLG